MKRIVCLITAILLFAFPFFASAESQPIPKVLKNLFDVSMVKPASTLTIEGNTLTSTVVWQEVPGLIDRFIVGHKYVVFLLFEGKRNNRASGRMKISGPDGYIDILRTSKWPEPSIYASTASTIAIGDVFEISFSVSKVSLCFDLSGGIASISDIVVLDVTEEEQKQDYDSEVVGNNLLPPDLFSSPVISNGSFDYFSLLLKPDTDYVFSFSDRLVQEGNLSVTAPSLYPLASVSCGDFGEGTGKVYPFRTGSNGIVSFSLSSSSEYFTDAQINIGSTPLPYTPYSQSTNISLALGFLSTCWNSFLSVVSEYKFVVIFVFAPFVFWLLSMLVGLFSGVGKEVSDMQPHGMAAVFSRFRSRRELNGFRIRGNVNKMTNQMKFVVVDGTRYYQNIDGKNNIKKWDDSVHARKGILYKLVQLFGGKKGKEDGKKKKGSYQIVNYHFHGSSNGYFQSGKSGKKSGSSGRKKSNKGKKEKPSNVQNGVNIDIQAD